MFTLPEFLNVSISGQEKKNQVKLLTATVVAYTILLLFWFFSEQEKQKIQQNRLSGD